MQGCPKAEWPDAPWWPRELWPERAGAKGGACRIFSREKVAQYQMQHLGTVLPNVGTLAEPWLEGRGHEITIRRLVRHVTLPWVVIVLMYVR